MDKLFAQFFVQARQISHHAADQRLCRMESLLPLKPLSCNVFWAKNYCWRHLKTSRQNDWYRQKQQRKFFSLLVFLDWKWICFMKRIFEQRLEFRVAKGPIVHELSRSCNVPRFCSKKKGKQRSKGVFVSPTKMYLIRGEYILRDCMQTM